jgi:hypothetical protein
VEKEHQFSGLTFFAALVVVFAVTVGVNYSKVSRQDPPTSVNVGIEPQWRLPNMVSGGGVERHSGNLPSLRGRAPAWFRSSSVRCRRRFGSTPSSSCTKCYAWIRNSYDSFNDHPSNVGLAVAVTNDSCPALPLPSCVFVDASPIRSHIGGYATYEYYLAVGVRASEPPDFAHVFLVDGSLASLCQSSTDDFFAKVRGHFVFSPSSARDMRDTRSLELTPVWLQLTRRRELARGGERWWRWGWGRTATRDRNFYQAELGPRVVFKRTTILSYSPLLYPLLAAEGVDSVRAQWADEAYRNSTVTPLMEEFWRDNGTNSYYFAMDINQRSEVVTYTQHDPVDPVALLGSYCKWL